MTFKANGEAFHRNNMTNLSAVMTSAGVFERVKFQRRIDRQQQDGHCTTSFRPRQLSVSCPVTIG